jgi:hypothetical protein
MRWREFDWRLNGSHIRDNFEIPINQSEQRWSIDGVAFCEHSAQAKNASVTIFNLSTSGLRETEAVGRLRRTAWPKRPRMRFSA